MWKRIFDLTVSTIALVILSPVLLVVALAIRLGSPGPVFHQAIRIGQGGRPFKLYKFRSMVINADRQGPGITASGDSRITPIGRILRRTKLDELPQIINVLRGDMSIVGPRPEDPRYVALYTAEQRKVLSVRPGITSLASVRYRNEEAILVGADWETIYIEQIMPEKVDIDLEYIQQANAWQDMWVIIRTFLSLWH